MEVGEVFKNKSNYEIKLKAESESGLKRGKKKETMLKRQILRINITSSKLTLYILQQLRKLRRHSAAHSNSDLILKTAC